MEIDTNEVYKQIKKQNGESFAKIIRKNNLLDVKDVVNILEFAGKKPVDAESVIQYLCFIKQDKETVQQPVQYTDPMLLLKQAGYDAFLVDTEEKQNSIRQYFRPTEKLCTFVDKTRFNRFYIIHAVKPNAKDIEPAQNPEREDEYGTSVISIQIAKHGGFISIKNRYNHAVNDSDSTFNNNPDNIIPGLSYCLQRRFNVSFTVSKCTLPTHYKLVQDQIVHYNYEVENAFFDENYYFNGGKITKIDKNKELVMDYFVLDKQQGKLLNPSKVPDSFVDVFNDEIRGKNIKTTKDKDTSETIILTVDKDTKQECEVARVLNGCITSLCLNVENVKNKFLSADTTIEKLSFPKLKSVDDEFLSNNSGVTELVLPKLRSVGNWFMAENKKISKLYLPQLGYVGGWFLFNNTGLSELKLPELRSVENDFLFNNTNISKVYLPNLQSVNAWFLYNNTNIQELYLPELQSVGGWFLFNNNNLKKIKIPKLQSLPSGFLSKTQKMQFKKNLMIIRNRLNKSR